MKKTINIHNQSVCVIIPYYNGSKYIERSATSVLNQTIKPTEFIVVDDGSTPQEADFLDKMAKKMGFKVFHKENGGQGSARNFGVAQTKCDFISFLDQDDFYLHNHIELLLNAVAWDDPNFGWVYADLYEGDEDGNIINTGILKKQKRDGVQKFAHPKEELIDLIAHDMFILPSASLISRKAYDAVGGFDPQFTGYEDDDLFMRIFRKGYTNYFIDKAVTVWCVNSNSTSYSIKMARSRLRYIEKLCSMFPDEPDRYRFYIKDLIVPRFFTSIANETRKAIKYPKTPHHLKTYHQRAEYIAILEDFIKTVNAHAKLKFKKNFKMKKKLLTYKFKNYIRSKIYRIKP